MTSYLNNGYDVMNYFAKFEKFLPHSIIIPECRKLNARVRSGGGGGGGGFSFKIQFGRYFM